MATDSKSIIDDATKKNIDSWLEGDYDEETKEQIRKLQEEDPQSLTDAFYTTLSFGTGGLRGIMGVGCNRMNDYTIRAATQGLANYINQNQVPGETPAVFIGYDSRNNSPSFAMESAKVLAGNGIKVYLSKQLRATPLVSFGCREKKCLAALVVTASHNPPAYNGFKVYWDDGAQVLFPHDSRIIIEVKKISSPSQVKIAQEGHELIEMVGDEHEESFVSVTNTLQNFKQDNSTKGSSLNVVYTSLHGTGINIVPRVLTDWGFKNVHIIEEQREPDGNFPTVAKPNPEEQEAMQLGINKLVELHSDILLGTDPDTDRMGAIVLHQGEPSFLSGNQISCILLYHLCEALSEQDRMPNRAAFISTIVSTDLFNIIAESYGGKCVDVLTGFKHIAKQIRDWESSPEGFNFVFGAEESFGYLIGTHVRDKDAISACALMCEAALQAKLHGKTLVDILHDIYHKYGVYADKLHTVNFAEGKKGREEMKKIMVRLREAPPTEFCGDAVALMEDYLKSTRTDIKTGVTETLDFPHSNVLLFRLENGNKIAIRPSGTEPKVKVYCGVMSKEISDLNAEILKCEKEASKLVEGMNTKLIALAKEETVEKEESSKT
ncbi:MAG: phosphomannomutase [Chlamydiales bacterium]|jgi:phosphomannomutase